MALAEWGLWDDELDDILLAQLVDSYSRRKRFEARMIALEVNRMLFGEREEGSSSKVTTSQALAVFDA